MTRLRYGAVLAAALLAECGGVSSGTPAKARHNAAAHAWYLAGLDSLSLRLRELDTALAVLNAAPTAAQRAFISARTAYKRVELLVEHYSPAAADQMNGPALVRMAEDDPNRTPLPPEGFQVLEEGLFPLPAGDRGPALRAELSRLRSHTARVHSYATSLVFTDAELLEAIRLGLARIAALTLSGFDSPLAQRSLPEAQGALGGIRALLSLLKSDSAQKAQADVVRQVDSAVVALDGGAFDTFDRLTFLRSRLQPLAHAVAAYGAAAGHVTRDAPRLWRAGSASVLDADAFDPAGPVATRRRRASREEVALGETLFFEPRLSADGSRSCATCHRPERAFTDGLRRSLPLASAAGATLRNAPTVINSGLQSGSFYDLRTAYLEDQVTDVVRNPAEMHGDLDSVARRLVTDSAYAVHFRSAFGEDVAPDATHVRWAIASYVRSLTALNSRFDRFVRGGDDSLSIEERLGFNLFMGKAKCGTCHFLPLFNGTVPPTYLETEVEVLGVPARPVVEGAVIDPDEGRARITQLPVHRFAFKTPTLRNVELTAPYMHNGVYATLDEVVDFYNRGGGSGIGIDLPNQTLPPTPLRLTVREQRAVVAFLRTLTDTLVRRGPASGP